MTPQYDLTVAYRIYPFISKVPPLYPDDKLKLVEACVHSFRESLGNLKVKVFFLLDACPPEYKETILKYFPEDDVEFREYSERKGNFGTFKEQIDILSTQEYSELVYFAEDDYIYLPNALQDLVQFMKDTPKADFSTPYDHPDYYHSLYHDYAAQVMYDSTRHWRTGASTTLTFMTRKSILKEVSSTLRSYSTENKDICVWMALTKINVWNFWKPLKYILSERWIFGYFRRTWQFNWKQILFGKSYSLWVPMPTLSTHMESDFLAPLIEWEPYFNKYKNG